MRRNAWHNARVVAFSLVISVTQSIVKMQADAAGGTEGYARTLKRVAETTRSWRYAEDGTSTLLECCCVVAALDNLGAESHDSSSLRHLQTAYC